MKKVAILIVASLFATFVFGQTQTQTPKTTDKKTPPSKEQVKPAPQKQDEGNVKKEPPKPDDGSAPVAPGKEDKIKKEPPASSNEGTPKPMPPVKDKAKPGTKPPEKQKDPGTKVEGNAPAKTDVLKKETPATSKEGGPKPMPPVKEKKDVKATETDKSVETPKK
jgi:hypothetical protein